MKWIIAIVLSLMFSAAAFAWHRGEPVTPYGDFCPKCSKYGTCKIMLTPSEAQNALEEYYHSKGLSVVVEQKTGRFIKAKVLDGNQVIDVIIFDRKTGRIRSIY